MLALLHHARPSSYCISHGPMKWRNLISYRDRLYTSKANIDVFELWAIWFVITKWKLEIGDPAWSRRLLIKFVQSSVYIPFDRWNKCFLSSLSSPLDISSPEDAYRLFYIFHYTVHRSCLTLLIFHNMDPRTDYIFHRTVHHRSCLTYSRMRIFGRIAFSVSLFIFFITSNHISCLILVTLIDSFRFVAIKTRILSKPARNVSSRWYFASLNICNVLTPPVLFDLDLKKKKNTLHLARYFSRIILLREKEIRNGTSYPSICHHSWRNDVLGKKIIHQR